MSARTPSRAPRRSVRLAVTVRHGSAAAVSGTCIDLSTTGFALVFAGAPATAPEPRDRLSVALNLTAPLIAESEVVWSERGADGSLQLGARFVSLASAQSAMLRDYLNSFRPTVLVVDPDGRREDYEPIAGDAQLLFAREAPEALALAERSDLRAVLVSDELDDMSWAALMDRLAAQSARAYFARILISEATLSGPVGELVQDGTLFALLSKPFSGADLSQLVARAVATMELEAENHRLQSELDRANQRLLRENAHLRQRLEGFAGFAHVVGASGQLRRALHQLDRARKAEVTVHLQGETGTGKELAARALHFGGPRASGPFVAQNCAAMSATLLHSTLFGHKRGAFTGADRDHPGVFEQAHGGTLFLDEVAELPMTTQAQLLRALQDGEVVPLGAERPIKVDIRLISATHKDLREEAKAGTLRNDLVFRLAVMTVRLPALRERTGDISLLARHFLDLMCERHGRDLRGFSSEAMAALERYAWPGNVRELENEIERLVVMAESGQRVGLELIAPHIRGDVATAAQPSADAFTVPGELSFDDSVELLTREWVESALRSAGGVVSHAAELLGVERTRLTKLRARLQRA